MKISKFLKYYFISVDVKKEYLFIPKVKLNEIK